MMKIKYYLTIERCKTGYFGANCDLSIDEPSSSLNELAERKRPYEGASEVVVAAAGAKLECAQACQNGGKCVSGRCRCDTRLYTGAQCQIRVVRACPSATSCMNGASCLPTGECLCAPGYVGARCQIKRLNSQCGSVTCYNGGTCFIDNQNEYACMCDPAFFGKYCQYKIAATTSKPPSSAVPIINDSTGNNNNNNVYLSVQEMLVITLVGIGMPVVLLLLTCFLCRVTIRKQFQHYPEPFSFISSSSSSSSSASSSATSTSSSRSSPLPLKTQVFHGYKKQFASNTQPPPQIKPQNIYVTNVSSQFGQQQDPNTIYASLYEDFVPAAVKNYVLESNYNVTSSIV